MTDNTTAFNNAISYLFSAAPSAGGTIGIPGHCVVKGAIAIPFTGTSPPVQPPLRITSASGYAWEGAANGLNTGGGGILDLQYTGGDNLHPAKIDTRGAGILEIDHLTISDTGGDNFLFLQTTNTTLRIHDVHFVGNTANSGTACLQDAIQLGGVTSASSTLGGTGSTNGFQGYGTELRNVTFSNMRACVYFGGSANGCMIYNCGVDYTCGSSQTYGAPYQFLGVGLGAGANTIYGGFIEITNYPYGISYTSNGSVNKSNHVIGTYIGDADVSHPSIACIYYDSNSIWNLYIPTVADEGLLPVTGPGYTQNTFIQINNAGPDPVNINELAWIIPAGIDVGGFGNYAWFRNRVGIQLAADTDPAYSLDIGAGTSVAGTTACILRLNGGNSASGDGSAIMFANGGSSIATIGNYSAVDGGSYSDIFTIDAGAAKQIAFPNNNKLVIGRETSSDDAILEIAASAGYGTYSGAAFTISNSTNDEQQMYMGYDASLNGGNGSGFIQSVYIGHADTPLLLNPNGGDVGIGTTSPNAALDVKGAILTEGVTFSGLPSSPVAGMISYVTDSTVNTAGSNVTIGGGSDKVLVWYNGSHWTVIGN